MVSAEGMVGDVDELTGEFWENSTLSIFEEALVFK